ncbi:HAD family hydrolase [Paenibacillus sp. GbtcB18]|uniref:HAD family hydrolase n=1 Tax=Paenibacillus sp. GbtcB18 TaxID=2824763 RepID=UPI001C308207|nr:HAD family hydrolase [Paenibacillus sp. GbtcB18]
MIFASDLDRTLIYSKTSMGQGINDEDLIPVELYEDEYISFMSKQALSLLNDISQLATFIPVTTRTIEQYQRVFHIVNTYTPKYAITSNGANILFDGVPDVEWSAIVQTALKTSATHNEVKALFDEMSSPEWALRGRLCDGIFYVIIIERDKLPASIIENLRNKLSILGWTLSIQGRKLYMIPSGISKGAALLHLKTRIGASYIAASGDSLLDESMLLAADFIFAPGHGELFDTYRFSSVYRFTESAGIKASEELLEGIKEAISMVSGTKAEKRRHYEKTNMV